MKFFRLVAAKAVCLGAFLAGSMAQGQILVPGEMMMVIDLSGSMAGKKLDDAKAAAIAVAAVAAQTNIRVSVMGFGGSCSQPVSTRLPFTSDLKVLTDFISNLKASGSTPLGAAVQEAYRNLKNRSTPNKMAIVLSDGQDTCRQAPLLQRISGDAGPFYSVGLGLSGQVNAVNQLEVIEARTGGSVSLAEDSKALSDIFSTIFLDWLRGLDEGEEEECDSEDSFFCDDDDWDF